MMGVGMTCYLGAAAAYWSAFCQVAIQPKGIRQSVYHIAKDHLKIERTCVKFEGSID